MSKIVDSLIDFAVGSVSNKARRWIAGKLKDGDIASENLRDAIIDDLNEIKMKIEGLARKDLNASYSFLKEGIVTLHLALNELDDEANADQDSGSKTTETTTRNESEPEVLNEAFKLLAAIQRLNNTSNRLVSTAKYFRAACEEATRAFCNEALSLPDRIFATKLRVVSKILECLQDTKAAIVGCRLFLQELHSLPAIRETFSTYFKGGIKSWVYKSSRLETVISVLSFNLAVSEFIARFSGELPDIITWPRIHVPTRDETIHPLVIDPFAWHIYAKAEYFVRAVGRIFLAPLVYNPLLSDEHAILYGNEVEMARQAFITNRARVWYIIKISPQTHAWL